MTEYGYRVSSPANSAPFLLPLALWVFDGIHKKPVLEDLRRKEKGKSKTASQNRNGVRARSQCRCVSNYESLGSAWILFRSLKLESRHMDDFNFINSFFWGDGPFLGWHSLSPEPALDTSVEWAVPHHGTAIRIKEDMSRTGKHNSCPLHFVKVLEARCFILEGYNLVCKEIEEVTYHNGGNSLWLGKEVPPSTKLPSPVCQQEGWHLLGTPLVSSEVHFKTCLPSSAHCQHGEQPLASPGHCLALTSQFLVLTTLLNFTTWPTSLTWQQE